MFKREHGIHSLKEFRHRLNNNRLNNKVYIKRGTIKTMLS